MEFFGLEATNETLIYIVQNSEKWFESLYFDGNNGKVIGMSDFSNENENR